MRDFLAVVQGITEGGLIWYNIRMNNEMFERKMLLWLAHSLDVWEIGVERRWSFKTEKELV